MKVSCDKEVKHPRKTSTSGATETTNGRGVTEETGSDERGASHKQK